MNTIAIDDWYLDSGASAHMCSIREYFENLNTCFTRDIRTAGKEMVKAVGKGTVKLSALIDGKLKFIKLVDALYVPDLRGNLLSVSAIADKGFKVEFNENSANVSNKDGSIVLRALKRNKIFVVKVAQPHEARIANFSDAII